MNYFCIYLTLLIIKCNIAFMNNVCNVTGIYFLVKHNLKLKKIENI